METLALDPLGEDDLVHVEQHVEVRHRGQIGDLESGWSTRSLAGDQHFRFAGMQLQFPPQQEHAVLLR